MKQESLLWIKPSVVVQGAAIARLAELIFQVQSSWSEQNHRKSCELTMKFSGK